MPASLLPASAADPAPTAGGADELPLGGPGQAGRLARALPGLVRWPNLAIMLLSLVLVRVMLLPGQSLRTVLLAPGFGLLVLTSLLVAAAGYIINDYYDVKIDAINRPDRLVVGRLLRRRHAMLAHMLLSGVGVVLAAALSWPLGLVTLAAVALLWGYSARFKRLPLVGNLSIGVLTAALVLLPELQLLTGREAVWLYALAAFLLTVVREIVKDMEDMRGDAQHGCHTLPLVWGLARSKWVAGVFLGCLALLVLAAASQLLVWDRWALAAWLLGLVLMPLAWLARLLLRADRRRHFRQLSAWCKGIMLAGVLSMLLV
ncbi:geranylgeranylglycerol-phosphate geranylgeranyltransferase [Hymenobacter baengnokdamensis]|uniref:geranylgeranylglycerol-phosphate geranylgeranyltransferase n=1 Tax=Hymenobacter baengnokdamensis TaxID=2615203 RepID=UPI001243E4D3|nr:geranylgeranylglycerol-phosphate geranylgeranyltransferase [Hymenobacter baengnokdamensis]